MTQYLNQRCSGFDVVPPGKDEKQINIVLRNSEVERATANLQLHSSRDLKLWMKFIFNTMNNPCFGIAFFIPCFLVSENRLAIVCCGQSQFVT